METQSDKIKTSIRKIHSNRRLATAIASIVAVGLFLTACLLKSMENRAQKSN